MTERLTISVVGHSAINREPERAILKVSVSQTANDQTSASRDVVQTAKAIQDMLATLTPKEPSGEATADAPVTHWSMSSMSTSSRHDRENNERTFVARTSFSVKFRDFNKLSAVASELSVMPNVSVSSVEWKLTDATVASLATESRTSAVHDALAKAQDYAKAFGYEKVEPREVSDSGYGLPSTQTASAMRSKKIPGVAGRTEESHELEFHPEAVSLNCCVHATFHAV
ncbi:hypothetical protein AJ79_05927 [Helicocarpus griseus UAMH5409]|uniref:SIMPL domain-containing protein n=1 Tax=Helicocarpus griseus UAMH5409 TaxID=1447875 RepID=A0A2B7XHX7_9EURO|nr:hypothetical protein AJ79_05927 [Helicocarpus griseus UAMH5409]